MSAQAQDYPTRPIRLIVPFSPGGTSDLLGRVVGAKVGEALGQTVVIDNRDGAGGTIGAQLAARAVADGHTLLVHHVGLAINETLYARRAYNALKDLVTVSKLGDTPNAVVVKNDLAAKSVQELLALAKKEPGRLDYGSAGVGSAGHLSVALLEYMAGVRFTHVPFKGGGPSMQATVGGQVHFAIPAFPTAVPHIKAGRLRIIGVTGTKREPTMPDIPTVAESGVSGYDFAIWFGMFAPAGTPQPVITRVNQVIVGALAQPEVRAQLARTGVDAESSTPQHLGSHLRAEIAKWAKVIKAAGVPLN